MSDSENEYSIGLSLSEPEEQAYSAAAVPRDHVALPRSMYHDLLESKQREEELIERFSIDVDEVLGFFEDYFAEPPLARSEYASGLKDEGEKRYQIAIDTIGTDREVAGARSRYAPDDVDGGTHGDLAYTGPATPAEADLLTDEIDSVWNIALTVRHSEVAADLAETFTTLSRRLVDLYDDEDPTTLGVDDVYVLLDAAKHTDDPRYDRAVNEMLWAFARELPVSADAGADERPSNFDWEALQRTIANFFVDHEELFDFFDAHADSGEADRTEYLRAVLLNHLPQQESG